MNDPHVSALVYRLKHTAAINYDQAAPLEYDNTDFKVIIENLEARFEMKGHFATAEEARSGCFPMEHVTPYSSAKPYRLNVFALT
jgi:hypothetical protein